MTSTKNQQLQIVWFKRDLRIFDNRVLAMAAERGPVLPLYVVEREFWHLPDASIRQWQFVEECLKELRGCLNRIGQPLVIRCGEMIQVLDELASAYPNVELWSHEETGNAWTYARDQRVAAWCRSEGIQWHQLQQHGTQRRLKSRNGWAKAWDTVMAEPLTRPPRLEPLPDLAIGGIPNARELGLTKNWCRERQTGGRKRGLSHLQSFLTGRGENYRTEMSNPLAGSTACSRISPYLAWGALSMREVAQATWSRQRELKQSSSGANANWRRSMKSFSGRLHWHCHFIQKLEDEPRLEFENLHPAYDNIRFAEPDGTRLAAWSNGETGLPFVDACMRYLAATGWLNFRMRAMLTAVASYHLWLDWRKPGEHLARSFTDYEPGIHWPQIQMQSGTTGINTVRIYNPVKQGHDQDPEGKFVRQWIPELASIEDRFLQEPWKADNAGSILGKKYPFPIVDHVLAAREARQKVWAVRSESGFRANAQAIQQKHGSRKSGVRVRRVKPGRTSSTSQLKLFSDTNGDT